MFFSSTRAVLATLALSALSVSARTGVTVKVVAPEAVTDIANLRVAATIINTGDETLKLLNDPNSPLSTLTTEVFSITDAAGNSPKFTGIKVKYSPELAAAAGHYTVFAPGQSITIQHDLSQTYDFTESGAGEYSFETNSHFYRVADDSSVSDLYAEVEASTSHLSL